MRVASETAGKRKWKTGHSHNPIVFVNGHRHGLVCSWSLSPLSSRRRTDSDGLSWLFLVFLVLLGALVNSPRWLHTWMDG